MLTRIETALTARRRKYLYRIGWAVLALLGVLGILDGQVRDAVLLVLAAVLGIADTHTDPTTPTGQPAREQRQPDVDTEGNPA